MAVVAIEDVVGDFVFGLANGLTVGVVSLRLSVGVCIELANVGLLRQGGGFGWM